MTRQEITAFYNKHYKRLYNASMRIVCNRFEAEEIMQDTIIKFLDTDNVPEDEVKISAWLLKTCIRKSIDKLREKKKSDLFIENYKEDYKNMTVSDRKDQTEIDYQIAKIKTALANLNDPYRLILTLSLIEGYDYKEIAEITEQKEVTIRSQFLRGKVKLIESLKVNNNS